MKPLKKSLPHSAGWYRQKKWIKSTGKLQEANAARLSESPKAAMLVLTQSIQTVYAAAAGLMHQIGLEEPLPLC